MRAELLFVPELPQHAHRRPVGPAGERGQPDVAHRIDNAGRAAVLLILQSLSMGLGGSWNHV